MSLPFHTIQQVPGCNLPAQMDRVQAGWLIGVANASGGTGAAVTTAISGLTLPANYGVWVNPGQDATWFISGKTNTGFNVVMTPRLAANSLAAGSFDVLIFC